MRVLTLALLGAVLVPLSASAQISQGAALPLADATFAAADGATVRLGEAMGESGLVVVLWSNTCPWSTRYIDRLTALVADYTPAGVSFVFVNSNDPSNERESADASREYAAARGLAAPYLADRDAALADALGATNAPHVYFFGPDRRLLYDGAIDDSPADVARVQAAYLRLAMDQSIAGLPIEVQRTQAFGCTIKRTGS
ncbi:MAG: redoxin domain-containing protein [Bacteroidota bacterium]